MLVKYILSTHEKFTIGKKIYYVFWLILACVFTTISVCILKLMRLDLYQETVFTMVFGVTLWPIYYIYLSRSFYKLFNEDLVVLFWKYDLDKGKKWYTNMAKKVFCVFSKKSIILTTLLILSSVLTIYFLLPLPFNNDMANTVGRLGFITILFIGVPSITILLALFQSLRDLANMVPSNVSYFTSGYNHYKNVKNYYVNLVWVIIPINFSLFIGFYKSPYCISGILPQPLLLWIIFISCWPTFLFFAVRFYLKKIELKLKEPVIQSYNRKVLKAALDFDSHFEIQTVKDKLEFKKYLTNYQNSENYFFQSILNVIPIVTCIGQLIIAFTNY